MPDPKLETIFPRKVDKPLVLYGYGKLGKLAEEALKVVGITPHAILDKDPRRSQILQQNITHAERKHMLAAVCIATESFYDVKNLLKTKKWGEVISIYDILEAYPECGVLGGWYSGKTDSLLDLGNKQKLRYLWSDLASRRLHAAFELWHKRRYEMRLRGCAITVDDRFSIPEVREALKEGDIVWKQTPGYTLADIKKRREEGANIVYTGHHDYIQMHFEGMELEAMKRNVEYFQEHRPIIDVTAYHTRDGLWKIPKFLMIKLPDYRFYFRLHAYMGVGAVVYAIPKERSKR